MDDQEAGMPMGAASQPGASEGTLLCIHVAGDGSLSFASAPGAAPANAQPAPDIGQALKMALDAYKTLDVQDGEKAFAAGFGQQQAAQRPAKGLM